MIDDEETQADIQERAIEAGNRAYMAALLNSDKTSGDAMLKKAIKLAGTYECEAVRREFYKLHPSSVQDTRNKAFRRARDRLTADLLKGTA